MNIDPNGNAWYNPFSWDWGKIGKAAIVIGATVAAITVTAFTLGASSFVSSILIGAALSAGTNLFAQTVINDKPFKDVNWKSVGFSLIEGGVAGAFSWGMGQIGSSIGSWFGNALSRTTHLSSGVKFGKVFGSSLMQKFFSKSGDIVGNIVGGVVIESFYNKFKGNNKFIGDTIDDEIQGSVPSWILELFFN